MPTVTMLVVVVVENDETPEEVVRAMHTVLRLHGHYPISVTLQPTL